MDPCCDRESGALDSYTRNLILALTRRLLPLANPCHQPESPPGPSPTAARPRRVSSQVSLNRSTLLTLPRLPSPRSPSVRRRPTFRLPALHQVSGIVTSKCRNGLSESWLAGSRSTILNWLMPRTCATWKRTSRSFLRSKPVDFRDEPATAPNSPRLVKTLLRVPSCRPDSRTITLVLDACLFISLASHCLILIFFLPPAGICRYLRNTISN